MFLGLDIGDKYVGIAIAYTGSLLATPKEVLLRANTKAESKIIEMVSNKDITHVIYGLPFDKFGKMTPQANKINDFIRRLKKRTRDDLQWVGTDESYTSKEASEFTLRKNIKRDDAYAAALLLERYLSEQAI